MKCCSRDNKVNQCGLPIAINDFLSVSLDELIKDFSTSK